MPFWSTKKAPPKVDMRPGAYRVEAPMVHVRGCAVIQDNGYLRGTMPGRNGNFLFTEVGAGVKPLVVLGRRGDLHKWLDDRRGTGIENRISSLPEIYMSVQPYNPGARFTGLFPLNDAVMNIFGSLTAMFGPSNDICDVIGGINDLKEARGFSVSEKVYHSSGKPVGDYSGILYVQFHYLQSTNSELISRNYLDWSVVDNMLTQVVG